MVSPRARAWIFAFVISMGPGLARVASATVAEQRARLPPPADCEDPVTGTWMAHTYSDNLRMWTEWTLTVGRDPAEREKLTGRIVNHSWDGPKADPKPPLCTGRLRAVISMDAEGKVEDGVIHFFGVGEWRLDEVLCGRWSGGYNLDHFSGQIDDALHEFQSVNNDGGMAVNEPTVFRRVRCLDDASLQLPAHVDPPPFQPPSSGCLGGF